MAPRIPMHNPRKIFQSSNLANGNSWHFFGSNEPSNQPSHGPNGTASLLFPSVLVWVFIVICITSLLTCLLTAIYLLHPCISTLVCASLALRWVVGGGWFMARHYFDDKDWGIHSPTTTTILWRVNIELTQHVALKSKWKLNRPLTISRTPRGWGGGGG